jgi:hypothetical protein
MTGRVTGVVDVEAGRAVVAAAVEGLDASADRARADARRTWTRRPRAFCARARRGCRLLGDRARASFHDTQVRGQLDQPLRMAGGLGGDGLVDDEDPDVQDGLHLAQSDAVAADAVEGRPVEVAGRRRRGRRCVGRRRRTPDSGPAHRVLPGPGPCLFVEDGVAEQDLRPGGPEQPEAVLAGADPSVLMDPLLLGVHVVALGGVRPATGTLRTQDRLPLPVGRLGGRALLPDLDRSVPPRPGDGGVALDRAGLPEPIVHGGHVSAGKGDALAGRHRRRRLARLVADVGTELFAAEQHRARLPPQRCPPAAPPWPQPASSTRSRAGPGRTGCGARGLLGSRTQTLRTPVRLPAGAVPRDGDTVTGSGRLVQEPGGPVAQSSGLRTGPPTRRGVGYGAPGRLSQATMSLSASS